MVLGLIVLVFFSCVLVRLLLSICWYVVVGVWFILVFSLISVFCCVVRGFVVFCKRLVVMIWGWKFLCCGCFWWFLVVNFLCSCWLVSCRLMGCFFVMMIWFRVCCWRFCVVGLRCWSRLLCLVLMICWVWIVWFCV